MSFILSCDFWFCCGGGANDDPADRYHHQPLPSSQTQMVAVVQQAPPPVAQQPACHRHQMPPNHVAPPLAPPHPVAMGYAIPPPHAPVATTPWPHVPSRATTSYDDPPHPVMRQPSAPPAPAAAAATATATVLYDDVPLVSQQTAPPRRVPTKSHHDLFLPATSTPSPAPLPSTKAQATALQQPAAQAPWWPARQTSSRRYDEMTPAPTQTPPATRAPSVVHHHHDPSPPSTTRTIPSRVVAASMEMKASLKMKACDEPPPAPAVTTSQRSPPQASWPTRQPSKTTYQTQMQGPPQVSYDDTPSVPAVAEDLPTAASMASRSYAAAASSGPLNHCMEY